MNEVNVILNIEFLWNFRFNLCNGDKYFDRTYEYFILLSKTSGKI